MMKFILFSIVFPASAIEMRIGAGKEDIMQVGSFGSVDQHKSIGMSSIKNVVKTRYTKIIASISQRLGHPRRAPSDDYQHSIHSAEHAADIGPP